MTHHTAEVWSDLLTLSLLSACTTAAFCTGRYTTSGIYLAITVALLICYSIIYTCISEEQQR